MLKKIGVISIFLVDLFIALGVHAENFDIENYEIYISVNKNRVAEVREFILADFKKASHGIFRDIPLKNSKVTDVYVDNTFITQQNGSNLRLKIGSPDRTVTGINKYNIAFKHHLYGNSKEFYYNIVGTDWPVNIHKVKFRIEMPAPFDASKVGLSIGEYGTRGFDGGAVFSVQDNIITGETLQNLPPHHGITVRLEVPSGYFIVDDNPAEIWVLLAIFLLTLLSFSLWFLYGKDWHIVPVVSFYPPKDTYVRDAELVCTEKITTKSLVAMIIVLAQQGYINIHHDKGQGFTLEKAKKYDGNDVAAQKFMDTLFPEYKNSAVTSVTQKELETSRSFYKKCAKIVASLDSSKKRFFSPMSVNFWMRCLMMALVLGVAGLTLFSLAHFDINVYNLSPYLGSLINIAVMVFILHKMGASYADIGKRLAIRIIPFVCMALFLFLIFSQSHVWDNLGLVDQSNFLQVYSGLIGTVITIVCYIQLPQLNLLGRQVKGQLLGLKKFIQVAEKSRLEQMVNENPEYFYDILPYAYILGVSDKWMKQFEDMMIKQPSWYAGRTFKLDTFNSLTSSIQSVTMPSIANGGVQRSSRGGGGFAGGGHGGGGGGSW